MNRRGVGKMIVYVLLVLLAFVFSVVAYGWLSISGVLGDVPACPSGVNVVIDDVSCRSGSDGNVAISLKNKGLFDVDGFIVRMHDREVADFGLYTLNSVGTPLSVGEGYSVGYDFSDVSSYVGSSINDATFIDVQSFLLDEDGNEVACKAYSSEFVQCDFCEDLDGDGYGYGDGCLVFDCNDYDGSVWVENACDYDGEQCGSYTVCSAVSDCPVPPVEECFDVYDQDCDGFADAIDNDCTGLPNGEIDSSSSGNDSDDDGSNDDSFESGSVDDDGVNCSMNTGWELFVDNKDVITLFGDKPSTGVRAYYYALVKILIEGWGPAGFNFLLDIPCEETYELGFIVVIDPDAVQDHEDFSVTCGGTTYEFIDSERDDEVDGLNTHIEYYVDCDFEEGVNQVVFSTIPSSGNSQSIKFYEFSVNGPIFS